MPAIDVPLLGNDTLVLRPLLECDVSGYLAAFRVDPELGRMLGMRDDPTEEWLRRQLESAPARREAGEWVELTIADRESDEFLGAIPLHHFHWADGRVEVGFWLTPSARGRGIARRGVAITIDWIFGPLDLERVELITTPENIRAQRLADALGFTQEGVLRRRALERGRRVDAVVFGLLRDEWPSGRWTS